MNTPVPPFDAVKPLAGRVLEQALNRLLALDEASRDKLRRLEGCRIEAHLQSPDVALAVDVCEGHLRIGPITPGVEADVSVKSRLSGLLHALPLLVQGKTAVGTCASAVTWSWRACCRIWSRASIPTGRRLS